MVSGSVGLSDGLEEANKEILAAGSALDSLHHDE
jgi:hypothetical protein